MQTNNQKQQNDREKLLSKQIHKILQEPCPLAQDLDFCLTKLDMEDSDDQVCPDSISLGGSLNNGASHEVNMSVLHQEIAPQHYQTMLTDQQQAKDLTNGDSIQRGIDLEQFKLKIKAIIGSPSCQLQPVAMGGAQLDQAKSQFSTSCKQKNPYKSRQVSIHTNAFLATECGDDFSHRNELFSTIFTTQVGSTHQRVTSNTTKSFFTQTNNNTFISQDQDNHQPYLNIAITSQSDCSPSPLQSTLQKQPPVTNPRSQLTQTTLDKFSSHLQSNQRNSKNTAVDQLDIKKFQQLLESQKQQLENEVKLKIQKRLVSNDQDLKLRKNLKRKIKAVIADPAEVPMSIFSKIISFDGKLLSVFTKLSRGFRKHLLFHIFETTQSINQTFMKKYGQVFQIEKRFISQTPISFGKEEGNRVDLILQVRVKKEAKKLENRSVIVGYCYSHEKTDQEQQLRESAIEGEFQSFYQFDLFKAGQKRWLWLHKDECLFHGLTDARAYSMPIMPICSGDSFTISMTLISLMGCLDVPSVRWMPLKIEALPNMDDVRDYNRFKNLTPDRDMFRKYFADLKRVCEAEDTVVEWFNEPYARTNSLKSHIKRRVDLKQFEDQFDIDNVEVGGIDFSVWKLHLKAKKTPKVSCKFYSDLNVGIKVEPLSSVSSGGICNEVKRLGFLIDRGENLELRGGDTFIVYVSMGGFEK